MNLAFQNTDEAIEQARQFKLAAAERLRKHPDDLRFATETTNAVWREYERYFLNARPAFEVGA